MATRVNNLQAGVYQSQTITRPADTTAYASGDLVANSTTAGSVVPFKIDFDDSGGGVATRIERVRLFKSGTSVTSAAFRVHFYSQAKTSLAGDNAPWSNTRAGYTGAFDVTVDRAFSDGAEGMGLSLTGTPMLIDSQGPIYAFLEARAAYTPGSAETFTIQIEAYRI